MKTLGAALIIVGLVLNIVIFWNVQQSYAMSVGPDCNENSLLEFPQDSPYFTKKIAFVSNIGSIDPTNFTLYTVNSDGTGKLDKIGIVPYQSSIAISSNGEKIAFLQYVDGVNQIFIANVDGSGLSQMTHGDDQKSLIGITPDGKSVIYEIVHSNDANLIPNFVSTDGTNKIQITNDKMKKYWPELSYDGSTLVFNDDSRPSKIFSVKTDGREFHYVTNGSLFSHAPVISANGSRVAFSRDNPTDTNSKYIYAMNTDGTNLVKLLSYPIYSQSDFTMSLDGSKVVFDDGKDNQFYVSVVNSDGTGYTRLGGYDSYYSHMPILSFDGSTIVYSADGLTQFLFTIDLQKSEKSLQMDSSMIGYEKEINLNASTVVYTKIINKTEVIMGTTNGKTFPLFDNSVFRPNPNCTISSGEAIISHPAIFTNTSVVEPWYDMISGWIWVSIVVGIVILFWLFYFRHSKE